MIFDQMILAIKTMFPTIEIEARQADDPKGFCFLNVGCEDGFEIAVEWKHDLGFGISSFSKTSHLLDGLFEPPDVWLASEDATFHLIMSMLIEHESRFNDKS